MKHAILLLWHKDIDQLFKLVSQFDNDFLFYIHLDKKEPISKLTIQQLSEIANVSAVYQKYDVHWGGLSIVKAEILLLEAITKDGIADYIHFMSGQDYPIQSIEHFKSFFNKHKGYEFIEYMPMPNQQWPSDGYERITYYGFYDWLNYHTSRGSRWIHKLIKYQKKIGFKRNLPNQFRCLYGGSNWMSITKECAEFVVSKKAKHRSFLRRLNHTLAPDECYFHTLILNSPFAPKVINNNVRLIIWANESPSPITFDENYWKEIVTSDCLLARKFEKEKSKKLIELINKGILTTESLSISENGSWQNNSLSVYSYDRGLAKGLLELLSSTDIKTVADFGCGPCWYLAPLKENGYHVQGYDGNIHIKYAADLLLSDPTLFKHSDLTVPLNDNKSFDLVISLGVGAYIPPKYESVFIENLTKHASKYLLVSWNNQTTISTQSLNPLTDAYLIDRMKQNHFKYNSILSNILRSRAVNESHKKSLMFFERTDL